MVCLVCADQLTGGAGAGATRRHNGQGGNYGPSVNGTDAADFGAFSPYTNVLTGGQLSAFSYVFTPGDFLKPMTAPVPFVTSLPLDQLSGLVWYQILGPVNNSVAPATFYLQCPVGHAVTSTCPTPGAAFTGFTRGGVPVVNEFNYDQFKYRPQHDPGAGAGYSDLNYVQYGGQTLSALKILGYSVMRLPTMPRAPPTGTTIPVCRATGGTRRS
jgi:hypothetical protein